jgi:flagellar hook-basal body complex protein FliE
MAAPILPVSTAPIAPIAAPAAAAPATGASAGLSPFQEIFSNAVQTVEAASQSASASVERFLAGEGEELHTTILASERAELSFDLFLQIRNKVVSAYQEIMRMQM